MVIGYPPGVIFLFYEQKIGCLRQILGVFCFKRLDDVFFPGNGKVVLGPSQPLPKNGLLGQELIPPGFLETQQH